MVVKVKLDGLNIVKARGRWYVYFRATKKPLIKAFDGTRAELLDRLRQPDMLAAYNAGRKRDLRHSYPDGTLGALIQWFENECPRYKRLSDATKKDYTAAFKYLHPEWDAPLDTITQAALYETRDTCAQAKWPRFADKMVSALSSMFSEAVKRGKMPANPAKGIEKAGKSDPNANREWLPGEVEAAMKAAPRHIKTPMMLARYAGYRGQTIAAIRWADYQDDPSFGKCFRVVARKNGERTWIPAMSELQDYLGGLTRTSLQIATNFDGQPWADEKQMQTAVSHFLRGLEEKGEIGAGTTLHGLRVTYAAALRRSGADTGSVAAALGDRSERMGAHYTRHVENEAKVIRAFEGKRNTK